MTVTEVTLKDKINVKVAEFDRTRMLRVVCGCDTWYLTLKEEHRLRVIRKRVLRNVLGPKREELTGDKGRWMGGVCGKWCIQGFGGGNRRGDTTWKTKAWMREQCGMDLQQDGMVWIGSFWLRIKISSGLL